MTIVFANQIFQRHETGPHPESPKRMKAIDDRLLASKLLDRCQRGEVTLLSPEALATVHDERQIKAAEAAARAGGGLLDPDTVVSAASFDVALRAAGTATAAVDAVLTGSHQNALCLIRPPGHHATHNRSMGFCLFNNVAIAARHAQAKHGVGRVMIIDWDVHHGNGTQDIFYEDESVTFVSIHRYPFYPGTGQETETGTGKGLGATINVPVAYGTSRNDYLDIFQRGVEKAAAIAKPELIIVSAGFDAHRDDPIGSLGLETEDFAAMTMIVGRIADHYCKGRLVSCLEGGYNVKALADSVDVHLGELIKRSSQR